MRPLFPLIFPKDSESLEILDIQLGEVGAKRPLNGTSKVNRHTNTHMDILTWRKHRPRGPMLWKWSVINGATPSSSCNLYLLLKILPISRCEPYFLFIWHKINRMVHQLWWLHQIEPIFFYSEGKIGPTILSLCVSLLKFFAQVFGVWASGDFKFMCTHLLQCFSLKTLKHPCV